MALTENKNEKLRVAVIGVGGIARNIHLPSLKEIEDVEIVALCDIIEQRAAEQAARFSIPRTYTLYKEMLAKEKPDAVVVLVEPSNLFHVTLSCLNEGFHTFMEKPPGVTSFQTASLARATKKADRILQVGFNRRFIPLIRRVLEIMREATTISQIVGRFMKRGTGAFDKGGLSAFPSDTIHVVDLVRWIAGAEPVKAATVQIQVNDVVPNAWNSVVRFENGVAGVIMANYQTGGRTHGFEIHGPGASAFINLGFGGQNCDATILAGKGKTAYSLAAKGAGGYEVQNIDGMELAGSKAFYRYYGYQPEIIHFFECVRSGQQPLTNIDDAVKTFEFVDLLLANQI